MSKESTPLLKSINDIKHLLPKSVLTKSQKKTFGPVDIGRLGNKSNIRAEVRYDDECKNGHNSFSITGEIRIDGKSIAFGCLHDDIAKAFPELAPLIKWHLCSSNGPMHYVANTVYHAGDHDHYGLRSGEIGKNGRVGEGKERNLEYARSSAIWPDATDEELCWDRDILTHKLLQRLPGLLQEFKAAVESLGFTY